LQNNQHIESTYCSCVTVRVKIEGSGLRRLPFWPRE
jgi:hypothetical protein